jgi:hypothetical protein
MIDRAQMVDVFHELNDVKQLVSDYASADPPILDEIHHDTGLLLQLSFRALEIVAALVGVHVPFRKPPFLRLSLKNDQDGLSYAIEDDRTAFFEYPHSSS